MDRYPLPAPFALDLRADGFVIVLPLPDGDRVTNAFLQERTDRADVDRLVGDVDVGAHQQGRRVDCQLLVPPTIDEAEHLLAVQVAGGPNAAGAPNAPV